MSIRDEARAEAEIQFPARDPREGETTYPWSSIAVFKRRAFAMGYIAGANREPSDAAVVTVAHHMAHAASDWTDIESGGHSHSPECANGEAYEDDARVALLAVQAVRRATADL